MKEPWVPVGSPTGTKRAASYTRWGPTFGTGWGYQPVLRGSFSTCCTVVTTGTDWCAYQYRKLNTDRPVLMWVFAVVTCTRCKLARSRHAFFFLSGESISADRGGRVINSDSSPQPFFIFLINLSMLFWGQNSRTIAQAPERINFDAAIGSPTSSIRACICVEIMHASLFLTDDRSLCFSEFLLKKRIEPIYKKNWVKNKTTRVRKPYN